jgi:hypothetical protein
MDNCYNFSVSQYGNAALRGGTVGALAGYGLAKVIDEASNPVDKSGKKIVTKGKFNKSNKIDPNYGKYISMGAGVGAIGNMARTAILRHNLKKHGYNPDVTITKREDGSPIYVKDGLGNSNSYNIRLAKRENTIPRRLLYTMGGIDLSGIPLHQDINVVQTDPRLVKYDKDRYNMVKAHEMGHANDPALDKIRFKMANSKDYFTRELAKAQWDRDKHDFERFADKWAIDKYGYSPDQLRDNMRKVYKSQMDKNYLGLTKLPGIRDWAKAKAEVNDRWYRGDELYKDAPDNMEKGTPKSAEAVDKAMKGLVIASKFIPKQ